MFLHFPLMQRELPTAVQRHTDQLKPDCYLLSIVCEDSLYEGYVYERMTLTSPTA